MYCFFVCLFVFLREKNRCRRIDKQLDQAYFFPAEKQKISPDRTLVRFWQIYFFLSYQVVQGKLFVYPGWCSKFSEQREQSVVAYNGKL